jgi:hypothetical protein
MNKNYSSEKHQTKIDEILAELSISAKQTLTLDGLIDKWELFVKAVEQVYSDSIYEYINDLSIREILQKIIDNATPKIVNQINIEIGIWDERFKTVTFMVDQPIIDEKKEKRNWWWYRIPIKLGDELKRDLETRGISFEEH